MPSMTAALHQLRIFVMCLVESLAALFHLIYSLLSFSGQSCRISGAEYTADIKKRDRVFVGKT